MKVAVFVFAIIIAAASASVIRSYGGGYGGGYGGYGGYVPTAVVGHSYYSAPSYYTAAAPIVYQEPAVRVVKYVSAGHGYGHGYGHAGYGHGLYGHGAYPVSVVPAYGGWIKK